MEKTVRDAKKKEGKGMAIDAQGDIVESEMEGGQGGRTDFSISSAQQKMSDQISHDRLYSCGETNYVPITYVGYSLQFASSFKV